MGFLHIDCRNENFWVDTDCSHFDNAGGDFLALWQLIKYGLLVMTQKCSVDQFHCKSMSKSEHWQENPWLQFGGGGVDGLILRSLLEPGIAISPNHYMVTFKILKQWLKQSLETQEGNVLQLDNARLHSTSTQEGCDVGSKHLPPPGANLAPCTSTISQNWRNTFMGTCWFRWKDWKDYQDLAEIKFSIILWWL